MGSPNHNPFTLEGGLDILTIAAIYSRGPRYVCLDWPLHSTDPGRVWLRFTPLGKCDNSIAMWPIDRLVVLNSDVRHVRCSLRRCLTAPSIRYVRPRRISDRSAHAFNSASSSVKGRSSPGRGLGNCGRFPTFLSGSQASCPVSRSDAARPDFCLTRSHLLMPYDACNCRAFFRGGLEIIIYASKRE